MDKVKVLTLIRDLLKSIKADPTQLAQLSKDMNESGHESSPANHHALAVYHSQMAGKFPETQYPQPYNHDNHMRHQMHSDIALAHYKMAGLDNKSAHEAHKKNMTTHMSLKPGQPAPFHEDKLRLNWQKKTGQQAPSGLGYDYTS